MNFAKNLKNARKKLDISQSELARRLNVVQGAIGNWENGTRTPSLKELVKIAEALNTTPAKLIE